MNEYMEVGVKAGMEARVEAGAKRGPGARAWNRGQKQGHTEAGESSKFSTMSMHAYTVAYMAE